MTEKLEQIQHVVQVLALPTIGQIRLVEDDCTRIDQLTGAFREAHTAARVEGSGALSPDQIRTLDRLEAQLAQVRCDYAPALCSELALRQSPEWRRVRALAREALVRFHWPLALPPREAIVQELGCGAVAFAA